MVVRSSLLLIYLRRVVFHNDDLTSYIFEIWAIQLELELVPKEIQNPGRIYKHATIVGNRISFQSIILMFALYL